MKCLRPWGSWSVLSEGKGFKIKFVEVLPNKRLSLQRHKLRAEHWLVLEGEAKVTKGENEYLLKPGRSIFIERGENHRLENILSAELKIIEIQCGKVLKEDDIERLEDDYGR